MKSRFLMLLTAITLFSALAIPPRLAAQDNRDHHHQHHHYKFIDIGTLGGPNSYFSSAGFGTKVLNDQGTVAGYGDTPFPDPYAPSCFDVDCYLAHAFRWQNGVRTDLGALPGVNNSAVAAINARGRIAGFSENGVIDPLTQSPELAAVLWKHDQIISLGTLGGNESLAISLNSRDQAVGAAANAIPDSFSMFGWGTQTRAFLWANGVMRDLGTLGGPDAGPGPGTMSINEKGQIAGASYTNSTPDPVLGVPTTDPFLWENGRMVDLGTLGGTLGAAAFLNNRGQVTGTSYLAGNVYVHPFLWDGGALRDLGTLGGNYGNAGWLNEAGDTVGSATLPGDQLSHATLWRNGVISDLGTVGGDGCSEGLAINSERQIAGQSFSCDFSTARAFLWENGSMTDLNTLIPPNSSLQLVFAANINDRGEIVGAGVPPGDPPNTDLYGRLFLLIPCDEHHPGVEGCDYSLVDTTTATRVNPAPATQHTAAWTPGNRMPVGRLNRLRFPWSQRSPGFRTEPAPDENQEPQTFTNDWEADHTLAPRCYFHCFTGYCQTTNDPRTRYLDGLCAGSVYGHCTAKPSAQCPSGQKAIKPSVFACSLGLQYVDLARKCSF